MIYGQKCPSKLLAQSETNLEEYVNRNLLFCSSAPMSTIPWGWITDISIKTNDLLRLCLSSSSAECGRSFWEETLCSTSSFTILRTSRDSLLAFSHGQVNTGSVDLKSYWLPQHLFPVCQWEEGAFSVVDFSMKKSAFIKYLGVIKIFISNCKWRCLLLEDALFLMPCERNKLQC